jgi:pyrimidine-specific ribonucleoside hydrolase
MGGSLTFGNSTPASEFNIWCDPEAAHVVFSNGVPIKMVGLNLTHQALVGPAEIRRMRAIGNQTGQIVGDLLAFHREQYGRVLGFLGVPLHDPCAVAWLIDPSLIESRSMHVAVELRGEHTRGMTVCDYRHLTANLEHQTAPERVHRGSPPNAEVGLRIDASRFFDLIVETLATYP